MTTKTHRVGLYISAGIAVAIGLFALYSVTPKATPPAPTGQVSLTQTPDYNACNIIAAGNIQKSFNGELITSIGDSARAGVKAANGTTADSCGYQLTTAQSTENSLSVQVSEYLPITNGDNKEANTSTWSEVSGSNPKAYFHKDVEGETIIYSLRVIPGGKNVVFELKQPLSNRALDEPVALDFLVGLAAKANYKAVEPTDSF